MRLPSDTTDPQMTQIEADLAIVGASLEASWFGNKIASRKSTWDKPDEALGTAYAMFKFLVNVGAGSGREIEWGQFLVEALKDCIYDAWEQDQAL